MSSHDTREHGLLVELDVIEGLQRKAEVAEKAVNTKETNDGKISQHSVKRFRSVVPSNRHWLLSSLHSSELLVDL